MFKQYNLSELYDLQCWIMASTLALTLFISYGVYKISSKQQDKKKNHESSNSYVHAFAAATLYLSIFLISAFYIEALMQNRCFEENTNQSIGEYLE